MYEEWFEKIAQELNITNVRQTDREIEIVLPEEISSLINGEKLFVKAYSINTRFKLKYIDKKVIILLTILNLKEHFVYYIVPLLEEVKEEIERKD